MFNIVLEDNDETMDDQLKTIADFISRCDPSKKPFLNQSFNDLDSVYDFYKEYGRVCGFVIRKSDGKKRLIREESGGWWCG